MVDENQMDENPTDLYYRPNVSEEVSLRRLNESFNKISNKNSHLWLALDFTLPGLDWSTSTMKQNCNFPTLHKHFLDMNACAQVTTVFL